CTVAVTLGVGGGAGAGVGAGTSSISNRVAELSETASGTVAPRSRAGAGVGSVRGGFDGTFAWNCRRTIATASARTIRTARIRSGVRMTHLNSADGPDGSGIPRGAAGRDPRPEHGWIPGSR